VCRIKRNEADGLLAHAAELLRIGPKGPLDAARLVLSVYGKVPPAIPHTEAHGMELGSVLIMPDRRACPPPSLFAYTSLRSLPKIRWAFSAWACMTRTNSGFSCSRRNVFEHEMPASL
jgi:hypothetical protein